MQSPISAEVGRLPDASMLVVEDDEGLQGALSLSFQSFGFSVRGARTVQDALEAIAEKPPAFATIDLKLPDGSGLEVLRRLRQARPDACATVLTGFGDISTAIAGAKAGLSDYLCKPVPAEEIAWMLLGGGRTAAARPPVVALSPARVRWEHIQTVFQAAGRNVSETARRLSMHRRTLQRILERPAPA